MKPFHWEMNPRLGRVPFGSLEFRGFDSQQPSFKCMACRPRFKRVITGDGIRYFALDGQSTFLFLSHSGFFQQTITTVPLAGMNEPLSYDQDSSELQPMMRSGIASAQTLAKKRQM